MTKTASSTRCLACSAGLVLAFLTSLPAAGSAAAPAASGSPRRAFEIADYYRAVSVESPAVAPDGGLVAFVVHRYDLPKAETWREIWTVRPDGSELRQMTTGHHDDDAPVFSPDGKRLLFTSDREGDTTQLYVIPVDAASARWCAT